MTDVLILNEPTAALRVIALRFDDLDPDHVWIDGEVKVSKNGLDFANAVNLPVAVDGGDDSAWNLELDATEVNAQGLLRVQFIVGGELLDEKTFQVRAAAAVDVAAVVAAIFAFIPDPDAPVGCQTIQEQWNCAMADAMADGTGIDGPIFAIKALSGLKTRLAGTVRSGNRVYTKRDGT